MVKLPNARVDNASLSVYEDIIKDDFSKSRQEGILMLPSGSILPVRPFKKPFAFSLPNGYNCENIHTHVVHTMHTVCSVALV
jgi:hypothetical protein